jgi:hypothetical protein
MSTAIAKPRHNEGWMNSTFMRTFAVNTMSSAELNKTSAALTREQILNALRSLSDKLREQNIVGEICLFGGTVMVLAFKARVSTKDVDALFQPSTPIRQLAASVAEEHHLTTDWLNDGVKGFVSARHELTFGNLPQFPNLRLTMPVPEYLLAMKCMAGRLGGTGEAVSDIPDIIFLVRHLKLTSAEAVLDLVARYYPPGRIPIKTQYLIQGLFEEGKI